LNTISNEAFKGCSNIKNINIPSNVTIIGENAFADCGIEDVSVAVNLFNSGNIDCNPIKTLNLLPSNSAIKDIPNGNGFETGFAHNAKSTLNSLNVAEGVTAVGNYAFADCASLVTINLPSTMTSIGIYAFYGCSGLYSFTIPDSVTTIGASAFENCSLLSAIVIPEAVLNLGSGSFKACANLCSVIMRADTPPQISTEIFEGCSDNFVIAVPASALFNYQQANNWSEYGNILTSVSAEARILSAIGFEINEASKTLNGVVPNATNIYSLADKITVSTGYIWKVYRDIDAKNELLSRTFSPLIGDNTVYILLVSSEGITRGFYTVNIYKNHLFTLTYDYDNGGTNPDSEIVEEGIKIPYKYAGYKEGYTLTGATDGTKQWDFDNDVITGNTSLTAIWTPNDYTITLNTNGGTELENASISATFDAEYLLPLPNRIGHTFVGWHTQLSDGVLYELSGTWTTADDTELYAIWSINSYELTLNLNISEAGTVYGEGDKVFDSEVTFTASTNDGYTWLGWYDGDTKISEEGSLSYTFNMPAEERNFTAKWIICPVLLEKNLAAAGEIGGISGATVLGEATTITAATNIGYTWLGWYDGDTKVSEDINLTYTFNMPLEEITYTARWNINQYTITFYSNEGTAVSPITQDYNTQVSAPAVPTKAGYTFVNWYTDDGTFNDEYEFSVIPAENIVLYAKWSINQYRITFDSNGGAIVIPILQDYNTSVNAPAAPTKTGHTFVNWYTDDETFNNAYEFTVIPAGNVSLYAKWTINQYTITFDSNDGTAVSPITQDYATAVTSPADPNRTGYTFKGWYTDDGTFLNAYTISTMPADDIALYAKWTINQYTVTFNSNEGTAVNPVMQDYFKEKDSHSLEWLFTKMI
ncbi:MAG: hypothetical protein EOM87_07135, partial [Clostridia bacterium]|nr:hypothetical protein [Clostridia bacterium]